MSLYEIFQDRVNSVPESGLELRAVFAAMGQVLDVIPDDDDVAQQQRQRRNELRAEGEVIHLSAIHTGNDSEEEEEEEVKNEAEHDANVDAEATTSMIFPEDVEVGSTEEENHDSSHHHSHSSSDSDSGSGFVSPTSMRTGQRFSSLEASEQENEEEEEEEDGDDAVSLNTYLDARVKAESTMQLRIFDHDSRQWLLQFLCFATKLYSEETDRYLSELHVLLNYMAVRRRRIELRSELLRARQKLGSAGGGATPSSSSAVTAAKGEVAVGTNNNNNNADDDDDASTELSDEEVRRVAVTLPDNLLRNKTVTLSSFFSIYVAVLMREEVPMRVLKSVCGEGLRLCAALRNCQRDPVDMVGQLRADMEDQATCFVGQWMTTGEGRLAPVMVSAAEPEKASVAAEGSHVNSMASSMVGSTVGSESVLDSEGNLIHATESEEDVEAPGETNKELPDETNEKEDKDENLPPPVDAATARALVDAYRSSRTPGQSELARLVVETVPGMTETALLPCIEQPERRAFNEGYLRLTPFLTDSEVTLLSTWMQVPLSELADEYSAAAETALVRAWASPTYDPKGGELTVLANPTNAFRMQLSNPASFSMGGMQCDMCCLGGRSVSYQAVLESGVRSEVVIGYEGCVGYDMCVACSYYYYKACEVRLLRAVHPDAAARQPFAYGQHSKIVVQSVRVVADDDKNAEVGSVVVEVEMGVSPFGVVPLGWVLPSEQTTALGIACPLSDEYVELTAAEHAALPVPCAGWQETCTVTNVSKRVVDGEAAETDVCPICLQLLHGPLPVLRTLCGHWFHVECIGSHYHYKPAVVDGEVNEANGCPVCRCSVYMPSLTDVEETLRTNVYKLHLRVNPGEASFAIAVGTILTDDGAYHNATNVAACSAFYGLTLGYTSPATVETETEAATPQ